MRLRLSPRSVVMCALFVLAAFALAGQGAGIAPRPTAPRPTFPSPRAPFTSRARRSESISPPPVRRAFISRSAVPCST